MVATRAKANGTTVPADENRVIAIVTGANSGFGLGICQSLLTNLSLPPGQPIPVSTPQLTALAPSQKHLLDKYAGPSQRISKSPPPTLTLVLACRSEGNAIEARELLLKKHDAELEKRRKDGMPVREGWLEGLRIEYETVDLSNPTGKNGVLRFCERIRARYPHVTSLFLNAAMMAADKINFLHFAKQIWEGGFVDSVTDPKFTPEIPGAMTEDGQRGLVWSVNVLSTFIIIRELFDLLQKSPKNLPFPPRVIYTSSYLAKYERLHADPLDDYQLIHYDQGYGDSTYKASKYMADLLMVQFDKEFAKSASSGEPEVRALVADPGYLSSNIFSAAFTRFFVIQKTLKFFYWLSFYLARLLGSPQHVIWATNGALSVLYAALIDQKFLMPAAKVPAPKFAVNVNRRGKTWIKYGEIDHWEDTLDIGEGLMRACETIRVQSRREEGLE